MKRVRSEFRVWEPFHIISYHFCIGIIIGIEIWAERIKRFHLFVFIGESNHNRVELPRQIFPHIRFYLSQKSVGMVIRISRISFDVITECSFMCHRIGFRYSHWRGSLKLKEQAASDKNWNRIKELPILEIIMNYKKNNVQLGNESKYIGQ